MLSELFTSITTSCPRYVRHMDYLDEAIAMGRRYRQNQAAWQPHLEHTRRFVFSAAEQCQKRNKIVILGSGLLLDVPLHELSSLFKEVLLLDIVLLPEVRRSVKRYNNVRLIQHDVTNMSEKLYRNIHQGPAELPTSSPDVPAIDKETDLVVSLNILSQLWVVPRAYALAKLRGLDEERVEDWCRQIVETHYAFLLSLSCGVCLIADREFIKRDSKGSIVSRGSTIASLVLPEPDAFWTWDIAPRSEERSFASKELIVGAWHIR